MRKSPERRIDDPTSAAARPGSAAIPERPRILIVKLSSLGDVVHAMPVVHDIRRVFPAAVIDWVAEPAFAPLLHRVTGLRRVVRCALRRWRRRWWTTAVRAEWRVFLSELRAERYDAVLDLQGLTKSALIARLAHGSSHGLANRTDGAGHEPPARWLVHNAIHVAPRTSAVERSRTLAARALGYSAVGMPVFGLGAPVGPGLSATVAFVHGTSRDDKLWPEAHWLELGRRMAASGLQIALPQSGAVERARAERWSARWRAAGVTCTVWPTLDLAEVTDRLAATTGVIGVDSGLSHIAVALGLPHVQIYNLPTSWRTGPQGSAVQVSVEADPAPDVDAVWAAWQHVRPSQP